MKEDVTIYQSMWFKPFIHDISNSDGLLNNGRNLGGWLKKKYFYIAWALSIYRIKKHYKKTVLVTDLIGKELLIDKLKFPYDEVDLELENLDTNHSLWAIGKLKTYAKPKTPFLHLDGDVFIWKKLPNFSHRNELIIQNFEYNENYYSLSLEEIDKYFDFIPNDIYKIVKERKNIVSVNAGTFGSNDNSFISQYVDAALEFVERNIAVLKHTDIGRFNTVYEQLLCYYMAKKRNIKITPVFKEVLPNKKKDVKSKLFNGQLVNFLENNKLNYIHPLGMNKKSLMISYQMEKRLEYEFPKIYKQILELEESNLLI